MPRTRKILLRTLKLVLVLYLLICVALYFFQEKLIFHPDRLEKDYPFAFSEPFEELNTRTGSGRLLNGLLFRADSARGLVFYLHGNAGALNTWGSVAKRYTALHYDVFIPDYPGYGKSEGAIRNQAQLLEDIQSAYDEMKKRYAETRIVVLGYSIGTGPAAQLASANHPRLLILQAPYYSLTDMMRHSYPLIPTFLLKYKLPTHRYLQNCHMPVIIFHGDQDEVIYYESSVKLKKEMKAADTLITLRGQAHNGITDNPQYIAALSTILK